VTRAAVGLWSQTGDAPGHIRQALERLSELGEVSANSDLYRLRESDDADARARYGLVAALTTGLDEDSLQCALTRVEAQEDATVPGALDALHAHVLAWDNAASNDVESAAVAARLLGADRAGAIERLVGTAKLVPPNALDYDRIGDAQTNYAALRPVSPFDLDLFSHVWAALDLPTFGQVLEIGCGTGRFSVLLAQAGARVTALDRSANMLAAARRDPAAHALDIRYVEADANSTLPPGPFDAITFFFSVQYLRLDAAFWERLRAACVPGGVVAFATFPHLHFAETEHARFFPGIPRIDMARFPSIPKLCAMLAESGFSDIAHDEVLRREQTCAQELIGRTAARYLSTFHLLDEAEFERGLAQMRSAYADLATVRRTIRAAVVSARRL
jgi:SAM-dependent methyltransferase